MSIHTDDLRDIAANYGWSVCDSAADEIDCLESKLSTAEAQLAEATDSLVTLREALDRLESCDWVITLPDRMDAVRTIAREALSTTSHAGNAAVERIRAEVIERLAEELPKVAYESAKGGTRVGAFKDYHIKAIQKHLRAALLNRAEAEKP